MKYNFLLEEFDRIRCSHFTIYKLDTDIPLSKEKITLLITVYPKYLLHSYSRVCSPCIRTLNLYLETQTLKNI